MDVQVIGARTAAARMRRRAAQIDRLELDREAQETARVAYRNAPKITGRLAASIDVRKVRDGHQVTIGDVVYAPPIHHGHRRRNIAPNPYLLNAARSRRQAVIRAVEARIRRIVNTF